MDLKLFIWELLDEWKLTRKRAVRTCSIALGCVQYACANLALRTSVQKEIEDEEIDYRARIEKVAGCLRKRSGKDAMKRIRELRDDE